MPGAPRPLQGCLAGATTGGTKLPDTTSVGQQPRDGADKEGEMPKEKFYFSGQVENDGRAPDITVSWGEAPQPQVLINGNAADRSGLNRLIRALRRARDQAYGQDA